MDVGISVRIWVYAFKPSFWDLHTVACNQIDRTNRFGKIEKIIPHGEMNFVDVKIPRKISNTFYTQFGDNIAYFFIVLFFLIGYSTSKLIKD